MYSRVYLEVPDAHRAEDLVQDVFLTAWRSLRQVTEPAGFRAWLLTTARTVTLDALRRDGRRKRTAPGHRRPVSPLFQDHAPGPPEAAQQSEERLRALAVLRSLPEEYRLPLTLRYLAGADYQTIGQQLGLSNGALRGLLNRGMARLRAAMKSDPNQV